MSIKLGDKVRCKVTGFEGIVVARCAYLNGCVHLSVQGTTLKDGVPTEPKWIDDVQLERVGDGVDMGEEGSRGGPSLLPPPPG